MAEPTGLFDLTGKLAVVTGCRRGIGLAITRALAYAGADIVGVSTNLEEHGGDVAEQVAAAGRTFIGYRVDLSYRAAALHLATMLGRLDRDIDILVNNASAVPRGPADRHTDENWDRVLAVNLDSPFVLSREIGKGMLVRGQGKIIFVASLLGLQGGVHLPGYAAAKSGITGLTQALANEWAVHGVNVNAIAPGYISTDNTLALRKDERRSQGVVERIPAGRWGRPDDLAGATVFLASAASDYVHGAVIPVDGGWQAR